MNKHLFLHRICKIFHYRHYYENEYGIKVHNKASFYLMNDVENVVDISPNIVRLGFDALKDEYTLCGTKIQDSPHYDLVRRINTGEDISNCEYVMREKNGTLDGRYEISPCNHIKIFEETKNQILSNSYKLPLVYKIDNDIYVFDGKHRLAMCCLFDITCKCRLIDNEELIKDDNTRRLHILLNGNIKYSRNNKLLDKIFL